MWKYSQGFFRTLAPAPAVFQSPAVIVSQVVRLYCKTRLSKLSDSEAGSGV